MVLSMRDNTFKERNTESIDSHGLTVQLIMVSSSKTTFKVKVNITGPMEENMMVSG